MGPDPLVSILVPTFNREEYIADCIESALAQTYPHFEVIVVDNASTDATCAIVEKLCAKDRRIRLYRNEVNLGPVNNWGRCLENAQGRLAKFLWSDDLIAPAFLSKTVPWLRDNPRTGFVYTAFEMFSGDDPHREASWPVGPSGLYCSSAYRQGVLADCRYPPSPGCALFRLEDLRRSLTREVPNRYGLNFSQHGVGADMLFYLKTSLDYPLFAFVNERLASFRYHPLSISAGSRMGSVPLLYALAKTQFLETSNVTEREIKRHNAYLFLLLKLFSCNTLGLNAPLSFYTVAKPNLSIDWLYMMRIGARYLWHEADRRFRRTISRLSSRQ